MIAFNGEWILFVYNMNRIVQLSVKSLIYSLIRTYVPIYNKIVIHLSQSLTMKQFSFTLISCPFVNAINRTEKEREKS